MCTHEICALLTPGRCSLAVGAIAIHAVDDGPALDQVLPERVAGAARHGVGKQAAVGPAAGEASISSGSAVERFLTGVHASTVTQPADLVKPKVQSDRVQARVTLRTNMTATLAALRARKARKSLAWFVRESWHVLEPETPLEWSWHHEALCAHLQWLLEGWKRKGIEPTYRMVARNLAINVPPGSLKSRIVCVCALAWWWLHAPTFKLIALSENPQVALRDADSCRELIRSKWYQTAFRPNWTLREDQDALGNFGNTVGGNRRSFGAGSKVTGLRADAIFVDDPNDAFEVLSPQSRSTTNGKWTRTANRVNDERRSLRVVIQQRVHADDLTGFILAQSRWTDENRSGWVHLMLPTEFDPDRCCVTPIFVDPRTTRGECLHAARYTREVLDAERVRLGAYGYAGQHDQNPSPDEGGMFARSMWKWWRPTGIEPAKARPHGCKTPDELPARVIDIKDMEWLAISVDAAFKGASTSDRVGLQVWGGKGADRFLIRNATRVRDFPTTLRDLRQLRVDYPRATRILVEDAANGAAIVDTLNAELGGLCLVKPQGGKASRAFASSPYVQAGNVYLLENGEGIELHLEECSVFPNGKHDDSVDAMTQLIIEMGVSPALARLVAAYGVPAKAVLHPSAHIPGMPGN